MVWANSILLGIGGLLVAVPILLHLLMQPKPKSMIFPALRFVRENQKTNQRRLRLRHWILLALRAILIFILAAALAGPSTASNRFGAWMTAGLFGIASLIVGVLLLASVLARKSDSNASGGGTIMLATLTALLLVLLGVFAYSLFQSLQGNDGPIIGDRRAPVAAAIIVDTSPRMDYQFQNNTALERAMEMGDWLIEQFPQDSQISVIPLEDDDPFFSVDSQAAKKRIATLRINYLTANLTEKIAAALDFLSTAEQQRRELYILTDLSLKSWQSDDSQSLSDLLAQYQDTSVYVVDVGTETIANFSIDQLKIKQSSITKDDSLNVQCRINGEGTGGQRNVRLLLEKPDLTRPVRSDGKTLLPDKYWQDVATVEVETDGSAIARFQLGKLDEGVHHGVIQIEGNDGLAIDNQRHFTIEVKPAWPVLVIRPAGSKEEFLLDFFDASPTSYAAKVIDQDDLGREDLADYRAVFLLDPTPLSDTTWNLFARYIEAGGSMAIFLGNNAADGQKSSLQFETEAALAVLPGRLTTVWRNDARDVFLSPAALTHPIMSGFRQNASSLRWNNFPVMRHWGLKQNDDDEAAPIEVILQYSNGVPAVVEKRIGQGRLVLMTTPISQPRKPDDTVSWNALTVGDCLPSYILIRGIGEYLVSLARGRLNYEVGQLAILPNDDRVFPQRYNVFSPRDEDASVLLANEQQVRYRFTDSPGSYRLKGNRDGVVLRGFSVQLPDQATRLQRINKEELDQKLGAGRYSLAADQFEVQREQGALRMGREFYPLLIMLLVIVLVLELMFSNLFYASSPRT